MCHDEEGSAMHKVPMGQYEEPILAKGTGSRKWVKPKVQQKMYNRQKVCVS